MYTRIVKSKTKDGIAEYVQLCHNRWDPEAGYSRTEVLYSFGRADQLDVEAIRRLIRSLSRLLPEKEALEITEQLGLDKGFQFLGSRELGGSWFLDCLWRRLAIDQILKRLLQSRAYQTPVERLIFAMVANRVLAPSSKLSMEHWVNHEVYICDLPEVEVHQLYRAMDFLLEASEEVQHEVFFSVANLFNLEVDLLFFDTTTTYFEIAHEDEQGFRQRGYNKDSRPDLPQVVIGFAVTRTGIPVRCWVWPGNTPDKEVIAEVKKDLNSWQLGRVVMVQDAGFNCESNRRLLQGAGGHYIIGEKLRAGAKGMSVAALKIGGKYRKLENGLAGKEVMINPDSEARRRFIVVYNPAEAEYDCLRRRDIIKEVETRLAELHQLDGEPHRRAACELRAHPTYGRYIRQTKNGKLRLNKMKIRREELFDGKFLVSTSDDGLSTEDVVLGYKQLAEVERVFRGLKHVIEIRPVNHRLPERIKAHILLCWLAMLIIRVAENEADKTWFQMDKTLSTLKLGINSCPEGEIQESNPLTAPQKELFKILKLPAPPRYFKLPTPRKRGEKT